MRHLLPALLVLILLGIPSSARADVAPPKNPPGSSPEPGTETTQVRMVAETVLIDVQPASVAGGFGRAHVTAEFTMHNTGSSTESMAARFPISADDGFGNFPEIENLVVRVDGKQVPYWRAGYPDVRYPTLYDNVPWAEFDVAFPAGQDLPIQVSYDVDGSGELPFTSFYYVLETGAGWKDTIGSANIILRLPYPASTQNVLLNLQVGWAETTPGGEINGNEVHWHFENFEPRSDGPINDLYFGLIAPSVWEPILEERGNVARAPNDAEAWGRLGKLYKQSLQMRKFTYRADEGGIEIYKLSIEAYEKCLQLKPEDAEWHAGFADLLIGHSAWETWDHGPTAETYRALREIRTALDLAPDDPVVQEIAQRITRMFPQGMTQTGGQYDFPWLTPTSTPLPPKAAVTQVPETATQPPAATETPKPSPTGPGAPATPAPKAGSPFCGSAVLVPLAGLILLRRRRR